MATSLADRLAVYLVADPEQATRDLLSDVERAIAGGVTAVQLRAKELSDRDALSLATRLRDLCRPRDVLFTVNDRLDVALSAGADGVHLGVTDLPVAAARRIAPAGFIIGYSPETDEQSRAAANQGADYVGIGPIFTTTSKADAFGEIGTTALARRVASLTIPAVGIGGITARNAAAVIEAGAAGVAVIGAILRAPDPQVATVALRAVVTTAREIRRAPARNT